MQTELRRSAQTKGAKRYILAEAAPHSVINSFKKAEPKREQHGSSLKEKSFELIRQSWLLRMSFLPSVFHLSTFTLHFAAAKPPHTSFGANFPELQPHNQQFLFISSSCTSRCRSSFRSEFNFNQLSNFYFFFPNKCPTRQDKKISHFS